MNKMKIGVIGVSNRGTIADHAHNPADGVVIAAGADPCGKALEGFALKYPEAALYDNYSDLLKRKDIDALFICSPDFCHEEQVVAALESGKAVYLEKPMAITIEGCDRILDTAASTGSKLYLGHNMRHFESVLTMKRIIDSGEIGKVQAVWCRHFVSYGGDAYFKDWHSERRNTTGLLLQKGAHDIDIIHWLAGGYTETVVGMGKLSVYGQCGRRDPEETGDAAFNIENWPPEKQTGLSPQIDVEDHSMILMQLDNGVQASYTQCHYTPDAWRNYTIIGTKGRIENKGDSGDCAVELYSRRTDGFAEPDVIYKLKGGTAHHGGADPQIVRRFIDYIRGTAQPQTSPVAARNAVAVGVKATESIREGNCLKKVPAYTPGV